MGTPCRIGIRNENGSISSIRCNYDGYIKKGVGEDLFKHYKTKEKILDLLKLGDLSRLGTEPVDNPKAWETCTTGEYEKYHPNNTCDTYKSRGENCPAKVSSNLTEFFKLANESWCDYRYLYEDGIWGLIYYSEDDEELYFLPVETYLL